MVDYWRHQNLIDAAIAAAVTALTWTLPTVGAPAAFQITPEGLILASRMWVAPALTLLGMTCATTAFVFTVVDRAEFGILRGSRSETQLWRVFSQIILWLTVSAIFAAVLTFIRPDLIGRVIFMLSTAIFLMVVISVGKFSWVMRQIISVRIAK